MKKVLLMILDGWGIAQKKEVSAVDQASTPFIDSLYKKYPHSKLNASGLAVGLPDGQMGNSEVGSAGIPNPDCSIIAINPTVFMATDFPPAFGPVIIKSCSLFSK